MKTVNRSSRMMSSTSLTKLGYAGAPLSSVPSLALEPRFMFDAAGAVTGIEAAQDSVAENEAQEEGNRMLETIARERAEREAESEAVERGTGESAEQVVVFIDRSVEGYEELLAGLDPDAEVIFIEPGQDGIEQMAAALEGRKGISAIHVLSHGDVGEVTLGAAQLNADNMGIYAEALAVIRDALSENGDVLLYGCASGAGGEGRAFVEGLAEVLEADVAASNDLTGDDDLGGDWDLELEVGSVEAGVIVSEAGQAAFDNTLFTWGGKQISPKTFEEALESFTRNQEAIRKAMEEAEKKDPRTGKQRSADMFGQGDVSSIYLMYDSDEMKYSRDTGLSLTTDNLKDGIPIAKDAMVPGRISEMTVLLKDKKDGDRLVVDWEKLESIGSVTENSDGTKTFTFKTGKISTPGLLSRSLSFEAKVIVTETESGLTLKTQSNSPLGSSTDAVEAFLEHVSLKNNLEEPPTGERSVEFRSTIATYGSFVRALNPEKGPRFAEPSILAVKIGEVPNTEIKSETVDETIEARKTDTDDNLEAVDGVVIGTGGGTDGLPDVGSVGVDGGYEAGDLVILPTVEGMRSVAPAGSAEALAFQGAVLGDAAGLEIDTAAGEEIPTEAGEGEGGALALGEELLDDTLEEVEDVEMLPEEDQGRVGALDETGADFGEALRQTEDEDNDRVRRLARALAGRKPTVEG